MNVCDEICVVCGEASAELICRACQALIGAKPLRAAAARKAKAAVPPERVSALEQAIEALHEVEVEELFPGAATAAVLPYADMLLPQVEEQSLALALGEGPVFKGEGAVPSGPGAAPPKASQPDGPVARERLPVLLLAAAALVALLLVVAS